MELPIRVMIVLFVSIAVGILVIQFSRNAINDSEERLLEFRQEAPKDSIIELSTGSNSQIAFLAEECLNKGKNKELDKKVCYAVRYAAPFTPSGATIVSEWTALGHTTSEINVSALIGATTAIFIYYDPRGIVEVIP